MLQLTDQIYEAAEKNLVSTIMGIDQSAAFDSICHKLLILKMKKYNFDQKTIEWMENYLNYRSQFVTIGGVKSNIKTVTTGIPQGSILGPTLYSIYVNELAEAIYDHENCEDTAHNNMEELFSEECETCGNVTNYADDSTFHVKNKHRENIQRTIDNKLEKLKVFLIANKLTINVTKNCANGNSPETEASKIEGKPSKDCSEIKPGRQRN